MFGEVCEGEWGSARQGWGGFTRAVDAEGGNKLKTQEAWIS